MNDKDRPENASGENGHPDGSDQSGNGAGSEPSAEEVLAEAERGVEDENDSLAAGIAEAERKAEEFLDQALRAQAELENTRKRTVREIERVRKYAIEAFASELLNVKDNLERGLSASMSAGAVEDVCEGMRLTLKSLEQVFDRFGITEVFPAGQEFAPELHQAMSTIKTSEHAPNTVIEVVQKGYSLSGRLLRPAMVIVAAAPGEEDVSADAGDDRQASET